MPPPKTMPSASTKASAFEGKAASSGRPASDSAAAGSGDKAVSKAPAPASKAASDSGVTAAPSTAKAPSIKSEKTSGATDANYPTIAESLGQKKGPPKKAPRLLRQHSLQPQKIRAQQPQRPDQGSSSAIYGLTPSAPPSPGPKAQSSNAPVPAKKAPPPAPAAPEKDCAMTYTERVMQAAAKAPATKDLTEAEFEKMVHGKWLRVLTESTERISRCHAPVEHPPPELMGELLQPQALVTPIKGGMMEYHSLQRRKGGLSSCRCPVCQVSSSGLFWQRRDVHRGRGALGCHCPIQTSSGSRGC